MEAEMEKPNMPVLRVNDATFAALTTIAKWLGTKTPAETLDRVVNEKFEQLGFERDNEPEEAIIRTGHDTMEFKTAPGLAFTKPLAASVNGKQIRSPRWSAILLNVITQLAAKGLKGEKLVRELGIPAKAEKYEDEGFKYHADLGISIQGQSAADAWREIERIADKWKFPVSIEFWWRQNSKAQHPGRTGILRAGNI
jgi:hypothetical protein